MIKVKQKEFNETDFRNAVLVLAMVQNLIDVADSDFCKQFFKGSTKRKLNMAVTSLEVDTRKYINKLYDTDDVLFQALQEGAKANLEYLLNNKIEDVINDTTEEVANN